MSKPVILTGIRSNEDPTIANYLGGFLPIVQMQREFAGQYQINMFVPDLHSFTTPIDHSTLYQNTLNNVKYFIAAGLDISSPDTFIYRQSFIPAHSELTWILDCFTGFGEMARMTQFKDKASTMLDESSQESFAENPDVVDFAGLRLKKSQERITMGLLNYPVLMAADILLYGAQHVPVGEDQFQHLEITRDLAIRFNNKFGETFVVPDATKDQSAFIKRDSGLRIRSLTDPMKKMSKSSEEPKSKILLTDSPEDAAAKIMGATTDSLGIINFDWEHQPGITSLLQMLALLSSRTQDDVNAEWVGTTRYGDFKRAVADAVANFLREFQGRLAAIDDAQLIAKLEESETAMRDAANTTLYKVQQSVGLRQKEA